jgi:hypothetical protein
MNKTSVYLADDEVEGLRRLAINTGRSQPPGLRHR